MVCDAYWELCYKARSVGTMQGVANNVDRAMREANAGVGVGVEGGQSRASWNLIEG